MRIISLNAGNDIIFDLLVDDKTSTDRAYVRLKTECTKKQWDLATSFLVTQKQVGDCDEGILKFRTYEIHKLMDNPLDDAILCLWGLDKRRKQGRYGDGTYFRYVNEADSAEKILEVFNRISLRFPEVTITVIIHDGYLTKFFLTDGSCNERFDVWPFQKWDNSVTFKT